MKVSELTVDQVSDMILEQYEKRYVKPNMNEMKALALCLVDARRLKPELLLAKAYAADWVHKNKPRGWKVVKNILRYKRILTLPNRIKVLLIPQWERFNLLMSHPIYKKLALEN